MRKFFGVTIAIFALSAIPVITHAQGSAAKPAPAAQKPAAPKATTVSGEVTAVAPDSVTVKGKTDSWTFNVDSKTTVMAKGATHKVTALKADAKAQTVDQFVAKGNQVSVTFHEADGKKVADKINVTSAAPKK